MPAPEVPDFSAVPPNEQPASEQPVSGQQASELPSKEQLSPAPRRTGRTLALAGFATAVVVGAVSATAYVADQRGGSDEIRFTSAQTGSGTGGQPGLLSQDSAAGSSTTPSATPSAPGGPDGDGGDGGDGHRGRGLGGRPGLPGLRGALHGELVVPQRGGTGTQTIVVQSGTVTAVSAKSLSVKSSDGFTATYLITSSTRVAAAAGGIMSLKKGDPVHVAATKSGSTLTALMVGGRPDRAGHPGKAPRPGPSSSSPPPSKGASSTA